MYMVLIAGGQSGRHPLTFLLVHSGKEVLFESVDLFTSKDVSMSVD
jgi:hypothetical protein